MVGRVCIASCRPFLLLIILLSAQFFVSIELRSLYFGKMAAHVYEDQTARTLKFARSWYRNGAFADKWLQFENVPSIEFQTIEQRFPYLSFLPGPVIPVYLVSLVTGKEPTVETVQSVNLATQFGAVLLLGLCAWMLSQGIAIPWRFAAAFFAGAAYTWLPFLMYEHQQVYYSDAATALPFAAFLAVTAYRVTNRGRGTDYIVLPVLLWFIFVNWSGLLAAALWACFRIAEHFRAGFAATCRALYPGVLAVGLALGFFLFQLYTAHMPEMFQNGLATRVNYYSFRLSYIAYLYDRVMLGHAAQAYGIAAIYIIITAMTYVLLHLAAVIVSGRLPRGAALARLEVATYCIILPLTLTFYAPTHYIHHDFAVISYAFALILVAFVLWPQLLVDLKGRASPALHKLTLIAGAAYLVGTYYEQGWTQYFNKQQYPDYAISDYLYRNAKYDDLVFSPNYESEIKYPTQEYALAMKRVYKIPSLSAIKTFSINDYKLPKMQNYHMTGHAYRLPVEQAKLFLLVRKQPPCWPMNQRLQDNLRTSATPVYDAPAFMYYSLNPGALPKTVEPLC